MKYFDRVAFDLKQYGCRPWGRGMRIRLKVEPIPRFNATEAQILDNFPLASDKIREFRAFAAVQANDAILQATA